LCFETAHFCFFCSFELLKRFFQTQPSNPIKNATNVPQEQQSAVYSHLQVFENFFKYEIHNNNYSSLLRLVKNAEKAKLLKDLLPLLVHRHKELVSAIADIPEEERESVMQLASRQPVLDLFNLVNVDIIRVLGKIRSEERESVFKLTCSLFHFLPQSSHNYRDNRAKSLIIAAVANIPLADRDAVINYAKQLLLHPNGFTVPRGYVQTMIRFIETVSTVVRTMDQILPLVTLARDLSGRTTIIEAVARILPEEIKDVITHVRELITPQMFPHDIAMQIENVAEIPRDQRAAFVENRRRGQVFVQQANLYRQWINVHEGTRDERVRTAIELLREKQKNLSLESIKKAKNEFIAYL
jgi:hypothetical protein